MIKQMGSSELNAMEGRITRRYMYSTLIAYSMSMIKRYCDEKEIHIND